MHRSLLVGRCIVVLLPDILIQYSYFVYSTGLCYNRVNPLKLVNMWSGEPMELSPLIAGPPATHSVTYLAISENLTTLTLFHSGARGRGCGQKGESRE